MENKIEFQIRYKQRIYTYLYGSEAYIFHTGVYNEVDRKYGIKALLKYVSSVHNAYLSDSNGTPLGELADFTAQNWKKVKHLDRYDLLDKFYQTNY